MKDLLDIKRKIFISYAFQNSDTLSFIQNKLRECGFEFISYIDTVSKEITGMSIENEIKKCDCCVFIISENNNDYSKYEYDIACELKKKIFVYIREKLQSEDIQALLENKIVRFWKNEEELATKIVEDISKYNYIYPYRGYQFEMLVEELFKLYGCTIKRGALIRNAQCDFYAKKNNMKFYIEVKNFRQMIIGKETISKVIQIVCKLDLQDNERFVLIAANVIPEKIKNQLRKFNNVLVIDICNLLYMVNKNERLKTKLLSLLEFSVEEIELQKPNDLMTLLEEPDDVININVDVENLISEIKFWKPNEKKSGEYENLCYRVLNVLFASDLTLWKEQQRSNEDLYRFDLICKIKDNILEPFWKFIEEYFRSKYIIFEFKNYDKKISQKEIYTTEKYLFAKALRCVAIIISCYGEDKNSNKAIKGTLRENGKLILSLSNADLIAMLEGMLSGVSPAEYLYSLLDTMLIELDK